jgi:hypothetical protein
LSTRRPIVRFAGGLFAADFAGYVLSVLQDKYIAIAAEFAGYVLNDDKWTFFQKKQLEWHARL